MRPLILLFVSFCIGLAAAQHNQPYPVTTPVPILKQINKHNEDGSYSYGFEAADGSYKIESKYPTGEVYGKYGFVDDTGNVREVEYGASKRGFEPVGSGINVPPPTLTGNSITTAAGSNEPEDDGQYREDPSVYHTDPRYTNGERYEPVPAPRYSQQSPSNFPAAAGYKPTSRFSAPIKYPQPAPAQLQPQYQSQYPTSVYQPQYQGQQQRLAYAAAPARNPYQAQSSTSVALKSGLASYTVNYRR